MRSSGFELVVQGPEPLEVCERERVRCLDRDQDVVVSTKQLAERVVLDDKRVVGVEQRLRAGVDHDRGQLSDGSRRERQAKRA